MKGSRGWPTTPAGLSKHGPFKQYLYERVEKDVNPRLSKFETVKKIDGVKRAKVSQPKGTAEITYDPAKTTPEAIARVINEKTNFKAETP